MHRVSHQVIVASVLERGGRYLCIEEWVEGELRINQPSGRLEIGETPADAAVRETLEESGYSFMPTHIVGVYEYFHIMSYTIYLRLAYTGALFVPDNRRARPEEPSIESVRWLTYEQLERTRERHRSPFVLQCVKDYRDGKAYPLDLVRHFPASLAE